MKEDEPALVCDATVVLNLGHRGELAALTAKLAAERRLVVTNEVEREVSLDDPAYYTQFLGEHFTINQDSLTRVPEVVQAASPLLLDAGEISVLSLCLQTGWTACVDETDGRRVAKKLQLTVMGTLGILNHAISRQWMNDAECLEAVRRLKQGGFYCPKVLANDDFADYFARMV